MKYQLFYYRYEEDYPDQPEFSEASDDLEQLKRIAEKHHTGEKWFITDEDKDTIVRED
jgi:hypothetical protein